MVYQIDLTDNEKRDAVKLIEAGKPLPDKYRFLLFDDDREVELVWNGKTAEVTNVVLPFQAIEQVDEPRSEDTGGGHKQTTLFDVDDRGRQLAGWTNTFTKKPGILEELAYRDTWGKVVDIFGNDTMKIIEVSV